jgi:cyclohexadieny/prephenate dehydrogenase
MTLDTMPRIAIMGLGLMGGSLGLALKARGYSGRISVYARREETRAAAQAQGLADEVFADPAAAVRDADLVIFCTPILTIPDLVAQSCPGLKPGAILTDVGSTKAELAQQIAPLIAATGACFVGSHPVAGSEQQGMEAARADLYEGALVVVTPDATTQATERVLHFWEALGATVKIVSAIEHDRLMARTSHLPHLLATLLAVTAARDDDTHRVGPYCGTGFRDTSRVADGSPDVWHDIVSTNSKAIAEELRAFRTGLNQLIEWTETSDFEKIRTILTAGRNGRRALMTHSPAE